MQNAVRKLFRTCPASLRLLLERSNRGRIVSRKLGKAAGGRRFMASPEASLIWAWPWSTGESDPVLTSFCAEFIKPGAVVWDFGAHMGVFSFTAAAYAGSGGKVLAVEPDPFLSNLMLRSERFRRPEDAPTTVLTAAVSAELGFATLEVPERSRASNALSGKSDCSQKGGVRNSFEVVVVTADHLARTYPAPSILKMDIEGSELDALKGGENIFKASKPVMLLEVYDNIAAETTRLLHALNYRLFDAENPGKPRKEISRATHNTLAIPE